MLKLSQQQLIELVKVGIWGTPLDTTLFRSSHVDWDEILSLCDQQTVVGIVSDAFSLMPQPLRPPKSKYFQFIKKTSEIENENIRLYDAIPNLVIELEKDGIKPMVLKGQGVGLCYRNPYRRTSGDVDLFIGFDANRYFKAKETVERLGGKVGEKTKDYRRHAAYILNDVIVELHGDIQLTISKLFDNTFHSWMVKCFNNEEWVRKKAGDTHLYMPPYRFDVIFIFAHALNHYMTSGLGIRQICDWMCYLNKYHDKIDVALLKRDLEELGLTKFWKIFGSMAVLCFGMDKSKMPLFDEQFLNKGDRILRHIFITGNFGYLQRKKQQVGGNKVIKKLKTFYGQLFVYWDNLWLFPCETFYCFNYFVVKGIKDLKKGI